MVDNIYEQFNLSLKTRDIQEENQDESVEDSEQENGDLALELTS